MKYLILIIYLIFSIACICCIYILNTIKENDLFVLCFSVILALKHLGGTFIVAKTNHVFVFPFLSCYLVGIYFLKYLIDRNDLLLVSVIILPFILYLLFYKIRIR